MAEQIILRRYLSPSVAHVAAERLRVEGIEATVHESGIYPSLSQIQGTLLRVDESYFGKANAILRRAELADDDPLPGGEGVVRCPRCELEYCFYGHPRATSEYLLEALLSHLFGAKRWHCDKCHYIWDNPSDGPEVPSQFHPDDPRPVFLLIRNRRGVGAFIGLMIGFLIRIIDHEGWLGSGWLLLGMGFGWLVGRAIAYGECSTPSCRTPLRSSQKQCSGCKRKVAGTIKSAAEHFAALADERRKADKQRQRRAAKQLKREASQAERMQSGDLVDAAPS